MLGCHLLALSPLPPSLTVLVLVIVILLGARHYFLQRPIPGIPHNADAAGTIMGDVPAMRTVTAGHRRDWIMNHPRRLGSPISQIFLAPFGRPFVVLSDFREAQDIMLRRIKDFDRSHRTNQQFGPVLPEHHITMKTIDPRFKRNKQLVRDLMTPAFLNEVSAPQIYSKISALVHLWDVKARLAAGRPFEASKDIWSSALDIIMGVAFGLPDSQSSVANEITHVTANPPRPPSSAHMPESTDIPAKFSHAPLPPELDACVTVTESVAVSMGSFFPIIAHWMYRQTAKMRNALRTKKAMMEREIGLSLARIQSGEKGMRCAVDHLLLTEMKMAEKAGREPDFYSQVIQDELMGYLIGGHDTTSTAVAWFTKFISKHQESQTRLREALRASHADAVAQGRFPTMQEIVHTQIPQLDAVIEETLRLARTLPIVMREAMCDTEILGHRIPKGTSILITTGAASIVTPAIPIDEHRRTDAARSTKWRYGEWDPEDIGVFRPERWLVTEAAGDGTEKHVYNPTAGPSLSFGGGVRGCFGRRLAYMELKMAVTMLVWAFEFQPLPSPHDRLDSLDRMTSLPEDCHVRLRRV